MSGRVGSAFDLAAVVALPLWTAAVIAAFFVVVCMLALVRGWPDGRSLTVARVALVLIAAVTAILVKQVVDKGEVLDIVPTTTTEASTTTSTTTASTSTTVVGTTSSVAGL